MKPASEALQNTRISKTCKLAAGLAVACAAAFVLALAYRPLSSVDLGYHLAYGEVFWREGRIVNDASFVAPPPAAEPAQPGDMPPGAYFDADGRYRFPNANWLTQVILAGLLRLGGWSALVALQVALVAVVLLAQAGVLRRLGVSWLWLAPVWLATGLIAYERFMLRPELLGYACLTVQLWLLVGRVTWGRIAAAAGVQLLAVNVHSYWLLGLALAVAFAADAAARGFWQKWIVAAPRIAEDVRRDGVKRLVTMGVFFSLALANPFTWRGAALPLQTLGYLRQHEIASATIEQVTQHYQAGDLHPWATIGEFYTPFTPGLMHTWATGTFIALLALTGVAGILLAIRRQWALLGVMAIGVAIALSMRRNIAPAGMILWPLVAAGLAWPMHALQARLAGRRGWRWAPPATLVLLGVLGAAGAVSVATNRFYVDERRDWRFGGGLSELSLPLATCQWLDQHLPERRPIFTDYNLSSSIAYFAQSCGGVPVLTNTWAYPANRMAEIMAICEGREAIDPFASGAGMDIAIVQFWPNRAKFVRGLLASGQWALVHTDTWFVVLARRTEANASLIAASEITAETVDTDDMIARAQQADPVPAFGLKVAAGMLQGLQWFGPAERVWRACVAAEPHWHEAWLNLGVCVGEQARQKLLTGDGSAIEGYRQAQQCFERALAIRPQYQPARTNLEQTRTAIRRIELVNRGL